MEPIIPVEQITLDLQPHAQQLFAILQGFRHQLIARDELIARQEEENISLRRASEAAAAHRVALEQLVRDCLNLIDNRDAGLCTDENEYQRCVSLAHACAQELLTTDEDDE